MTQSTFNWTTFTKQIFIKADVERVFRAWATSGGMEQWFIAEATITTPDGTPRPDMAIAQPGDHYQWRWHQDLQTAGEVLQVVENKCFQFTFGDKGDGSGEKIIVTVTFDQQGDETLVELTQNNMGDTLLDHSRWYVSCNLGWTFFVTNLKALLEHGVDLRETDPDRAYASRAISH